MWDGKTAKSEVSSSKNELVIGILFINISRTFRDLATILSTIWVLPRGDQDIFSPVSGRGASCFSLLLRGDKPFIQLVIDFSMRYNVLLVLVTP